MCRRGAPGPSLHLRFLSCFPIRKGRFVRTSSLLSLVLCVRRVLSQMALALLFSPTSLWHSSRKHGCPTSGGKGILWSPLMLSWILLEVTYIKQIFWIFLVSLGRNSRRSQWAWSEVKALSLSWPQGLHVAHIATIPKSEGDSSLLGQRPLCVLPVDLSCTGFTCAEASARLVLVLGPKLRVQCWYRSFFS